MNLIKRYRELFPKTGKRIGCTSLTAHVIETGNAEPVHCPPYRTSLKKQELFQREVEKSLKADIVEPSFSCWSSPFL